jgi:UV DNA damage endonuclease
VSVHNIGAFRVLSPLFPRYTHPAVGYTIDDLPESGAIRDLCQRIRTFRERLDIRLSLHPDQFNVLSSPNSSVVDKTLEELEYQGVLAELIGAEVINIHGGGAYGDKAAALGRFAANFGRLSERVRKRLTLENDDISYTPADLLPLCRQLDIPFVYDAHHHRCLPDGLSLEVATDRCISSWESRGREPYFHISSPRHGWRAKNPRTHGDYVDPDDFPRRWLELDATVDIEAKAKELAVQRLMHDLQVQNWSG